MRKLNLVLRFSLASQIHAISLTEHMIATCNRECEEYSRNLEEALPR